MTRLLVGLLLLASCVVPAHSQEEPKGNLVIILDGSGSMWGRLPGDIPRVVAAREALGHLAGQLAGREMQVGLVAYGHRRRGRCDDIATVVEPGPLDPENFAEGVRRVNPLGMTPIAGALRHGAGLLQPLEGPSTLVLITDGLENCRQDPCQVVEELQRTGADFTVQVVGLALGETDPAPLRCIARAGGGRYVAVEEAAGLLPALTDLVGITGEGGIDDTTSVSLPDTAAFGEESVEGGVEEQAPAVQDYVIGRLAPLTGSSQLAVTVTLNGAPAGAEVALYPADSRRRLARALVHPRPGGNRHAFRLDPGRYDLEVTPRGLAGEITRTLEGVEVGARGEGLTVDFAAGTLTLGATVNDRPTEADIRVLPAGGGEQLARERLFARPAGNPRTLRLTPGRYDVEIRLSRVAGEPVQRLEGLEITAGDTLERQVAFRAGELTLAVTVNGRPTSADVTLTPAGGERRLLWKRIYNRAGDNPYTFLLPAGRYDLRVEARQLLGQPVLEQTGLEVAAGEVVTQQADFEAGELRVAAVGDGRPALADVAVYPAGGGDRLIEVRLYPRPEGNPRTLLLPPGRYDLEVNGPGGERVESLYGIDIGAGERVERTVTVPVEP